MSIQPSHLPRRLGAKLGALLVAALSLGGAAILASVGGPHGAVEGLAAVLETLAKAGFGAGLYVLAGVGFGRLMLPRFGEDSRFALQLACGVGAMLVLTQVLGVTGVLFVRPAGVPAALVVELVGIGLLVAQVVSDARGGKLSFGAVATDRWILIARLLWIPPILVLLVAACQPPGRLWASEFGGFDALSYHLQLPNEWFAAGRIWPVEHNVYSYLPGLVEGAFVHAHAAAWGVSAGELRERGLLSGNARGAIGPQVLHALLTIASAMVISAFGRVLAKRSGAPDVVAARAGLLAGAIFLATPWTIVVGSLAYNEMGMVLGLAGAMLVCVVPSMGSGVRGAACRGALAGFLVGVACGSKPTALVFAGAPVGLLLLGLLPVRLWLPAVAGGSAAGVLALMPWLVRNEIACGNPVFPFAPGVFGAGHWTTEQFARFLAAHHFDGSMWERVRLLFLPDASDPAGARHRGLMHPQFAWFFPVAVVALVSAAAARPTRKLAVLLGLGLAAQVVAWMWLTHLQSRFLVPLMVPACGVLALACSLEGRGRAARYAPGVLAMLAAGVACGFAIVSIVIFSREDGGRPNAGLVDGPASFTGQHVPHELALRPEAERRQLIGQFPPEWFVNIGAEALGAADSSRRGTLYLLGDSTPFYFRAPTLYNTTWDRSALGEAMREHPGEPAAWTHELEERGVRYVLVNFSELSRLNASGPGGRSWFDPSVTPEAAAGWAKTLGAPVAQWPESGRYLFRVGR